MAITPTFWSTQRLTAPQPAQEVVQPTTGETQPIPYKHLPGGESGIDPTELREGRDATFPLLNGTTVVLPTKPDAFGLNPSRLSAAEFRKWHSSHQVEYARSNSGAPGSEFTIDSADDRLSVMVSTVDPAKIYIINDLQKRDFAKMPKADQEKIAATNYFKDILAPRFGLTPTSDLTIAQAQAAVEAKVNTLRNSIITNTSFPFFNTSDGGATWSRKGGITDTSKFKLMTVTDAEIFLKELDNITARIRTSAVFSPADIDTAVNDVEKRWKRASTFANVEESNPLDSAYSNQLGTGFYGLDLNDDLSQIKAAYTSFMAQEARILELDNARLDYARNGTIAAKNLDVPTLVFLFQLNYNLVVEAKVTADAEEVTQFNNLLKIYSAMQDLVNQTSAKFDPSDNDQEKSLLGFSRDDTVSGKINNGISNAQLRTVAMFEDILSNASSRPHPIESLYNIERPTFDMIVNTTTDGKTNRWEDHYKTAWDSFGTRLSDKVTLINQESQIKTNDINSLDKQKNRHFDLANGALSKLSDMIQSIGRNVS